jgi:hypothetical protein
VQDNAFFDSLLSHCNLDDESDTEISLSDDKFEKAVGLLKEREN